MDLLSVSSGMDPRHVSKSLRRIAAKVDSAGSPSARKVLTSLSRVAEAVEKEKPVKVVVLHGPFRKAKDTEIRGGYGSETESGEIEDGFLVQNDEFLAMAAEAAGPDTTPADFDDGYHQFVVELSFYTEPPDPSVGWRGGTELDGWSLVALDGIVLENEDDRRAVESELESTVESLKDDWVEDYVRSAAEYAAEAMYEERH